MDADQKTVERLVFADLTQDVYRDVMDTLEAQILRLMQTAESPLRMQMSRYFDQAGDQFNARLMQLAEGSSIPVPSSLTSPSPLPLTPEPQPRAVANAPTLNRTKSFINSDPSHVHDIPKVKKALFQDIVGDDAPIIIDDISSDEEEEEDDYAPSSSEEIEEEEYTEAEVLVYATDEDTEEY